MFVMSVKKAGRMKSKKPMNKETQDVLNAILELTGLGKKATRGQVLGVFLKHCGSTVKVK